MALAANRRDKVLRALARDDLGYPGLPSSAAAIRFEMPGPAAGICCVVARFRLAVLPQDGWDGGAGEGAHSAAPARVDTMLSGDLSGVSSSAARVIASVWWVMWRL